MARIATNVVVTLPGNKLRISYGARNVYSDVKVSRGVSNTGRVRMSHTDKRNKGYTAKDIVTSFVK